MTLDLVAQGQEGLLLNLEERKGQKMNVGMECDEGDHGDAHAAEVPNQLVITSDPPEDPSKRKYRKSQGSTRV